jgi:hypothetical protein
MKRLLLAIVILSACTPENKVDPASASTFVHYFNGGNSDVAQQVVQTSDNGFIILATTEIKTSELTPSLFKIKLIKTDAFGNQLWQSFFPDFESSDKSYKGNSLITLPDGGYVIAGEDIQNTLPKLMILRVNSDGAQVSQTTLNSQISVNGIGVSQDSDGNFWALGSILNSTTDKNMLLSKFDKTSLDSLWSYQYGAGQSTLAPRLFLNAQNDAYWGGTIQKDNTNSSIRFVKVQTNSTNTGGIDFDLPLSSPQYTETGNDFCRYGSGFAIIGSTNQKESGTGDLDILFKRISDNGEELSSKSFPIADQQQNETGNSICATRDGGLLLLGTIDTQGDLGRGDKDYYLIKINAFGEVDWTQDYGSKFEDDGASVIQASDGGYVVLGTSSIGRVKTVMLMKTDKNGKIE